MTQKEISKQFLERSITNELESVFKELIHQDFINHNPSIKHDRDTLLNAMMKDNEIAPNKKIHIIMQIEENELVTTLSRLNYDNMSFYDLVHIFKLQDDKIIESWDFSNEIQCTE